MYLMATGMMLVPVPCNMTGLGVAMRSTVGVPVSRDRSGQLALIRLRILSVQSNLNIGFRLRAAIGFLPMIASVDQVRI